MTKRLNKLFKYLLFAIFLIVNLYGQSIPDYQERNLITRKDSTGIAINTEVTPTEGSVDPQLYFIGPGDKLFISIRGITEQNFTLIINQEGSLFIPKIGIIDLKNKTLSETKEIIKKHLLSTYKNVDIQIALVDLRKIKVTLTGTVGKPSSYILSSNCRLLDLFLQPYSSIQKNADLRNIKIIDQNNSEKLYDLLSFLRLGDKLCNPYLREGDIVILATADKTISILGAVKNPGTFEYVENETAEHLLSLAGGFLDKAKKDTIELTRFLDDNKTIKSYYYNYNDLKDKQIIMQKSDRLIVREKPEYMIDQFISVHGFVKYPGVYKIADDKTSLRSLLINEAGGFLEKASLKDAYIIRTTGAEDKDPEFERLKSIPRADMNDDEYDYLKQKSRQVKGRMVVDFERLFSKNDLSEDLVLKRGDEITIPENKQYITLVGQVINPGNVAFKEGLQVEDYIKLAGGFSWRAIKNDIRVIKSNSGEWLDESDVDKLEPGDVIWVPEDPPSPKFWDVFQKSLNIVGQVATVIAATVAIIVASRK